MLRVSSGFQPPKNNKTTRPASSWFQLFLAFGNLMKPLHSFLKYYFKNRFLSKLKNFFTEVHCMKYRIRWENQNFDDIGTLSAKLYLLSLFKMHELFQYSHTIYHSFGFCYLSPSTWPTAKHRKTSLYVSTLTSKYMLTQGVKMKERKENYWIKNDYIRARRKCCPIARG